MNAIPCLIRSALHGEVTLINIEVFKMAMTKNDSFPVVTNWSEVTPLHHRIVCNNVNNPSSKALPAPIGWKHTLETDEQVLIFAAKQGNVEAFNQLVLAYQDKVFTQAYYILGNRMSAEDAVQEAFISAYKSIKSYRGGSFRGWLFRIVTNKCLDELRDRKHYLETDFEDNDEWFSGIDSPSWPDSSGETPEDRLLSAETEQYLCLCLNRLTTKYRIAIILVDILDMRYDEAAKIMHCPLGTVKSRLARARLQMRYFLQDHRSVICL
jgi:RNA polymerase sigma-70 factor (ECF subfamily)